MSVASKQVGASGQSRGVHNGICRSKLVSGAQLSSRKGNRRIQFGDDAGLGERNHLIGLVFADLSSYSFGELELHDCRHQPLIPRRKLRRQSGADWRSYQPLNPGRGVDQAHQTRSVRSL